MAAPVVQVLVNSERNYVINVVGEADTTGGTIVDVSTIAADACGTVSKVKLMKLEYETDAAIKLDWDATADKTFVVMAPGQDVKDYCDVGGLVNDAGTGVTGDVLIPAPAASANYSFTAWFVKKYA